MSLREASELQERHSGEQSVARSSLMTAPSLKATRLVPVCKRTCATQMCITFRFQPFSAQIATVLDLQSVMTLKMLCLKLFATSEQPE